MMPGPSEINRLLQAAGAIGDHELTEDGLALESSLRNLAKRWMLESLGIFDVLGRSH